MSPSPGRKRLVIEASDRIIPALVDIAMPRFSTHSMTTPAPEGDGHQYQGRHWDLTQQQGRGGLFIPVDEDEDRQQHGIPQRRVDPKMIILEHKPDWKENPDFAG